MLADCIVFVMSTVLKEVAEAEPSCLDIEAELLIWGGDKAIISDTSNTDSWIQVDESELISLSDNL